MALVIFPYYFYPLTYPPFLFLRLLIKIMALPQKAARPKFINVIIKNQYCQKFMTSVKRRFTFGARKSL